jgi:hypothetical protein
MVLIPEITQPCFKSDIKLASKDFNSGHVETTMPLHVSATICLDFLCQERQMDATFKLFYI